MKPTHPLHSLLSGNQTHETDVFCSAFLDTINGGSGSQAEIGPLTVNSDGSLTQPISSTTLVTPGYWVVTDP